MAQSVVSRRDFLKVSSTAGAGLMIGVFLPVKKRFVDAGLVSEQSFDPSAFLSINPDNTVTITVARSEMGQRVRTSLPMIIADELGADWSQVNITQADAHPDKYGSQSTGGSGSVRTSFEKLRKAGAAAREMLIETGANEWNVNKSECTVSNGKVVHSSTGRQLTFGELTKKAANLPIPEDPPLKDMKDFKLIGKSIPGLDTPSLVDGSAQFGMDVKLPNMLYATVFRCPTFGGTVKSFDSRVAKKIKGVKDIFEIKKGVAVIGTNTWAVIKAKRAVNIEWDHGEFVDWDSNRIRNMMQNKGIGNAVVVSEEGNVAQAQKDANDIIEAVYEVPFTYHATMEPMNCVAHVKNGSCEIWVPTQVPQKVQTTIAEALGFPEENITVHVTMLGGGFGRRLRVDYASDAVEISQKTGKPVLMFWTREEDMAHDFYRPTSIHKLSSSMTKKKQTTSWSHRVVSPSVVGQENPERSKEALAMSGTYGARNLAYEIPNILIDYVMTNTEVPIGWWRSVYQSQNAFANEGFIDELAYAANTDPYEFRLKLLKDSPRHVGVLKLAAEKAGWGTKLSKGKGRGIAVQNSFGSWAAHVAEVTVKSNGNFSVDRIVSAIDCGIVVHPDGLKMQIEGAIVFALTSTLGGEITIKDGAVEQSNFHEFELLRIDEMPEVEVHIVESTESPGGAGEPGVPPLAPAVTNAIFAATGKRIRSLPIKPENLINKILGSSD